MYLALIVICRRIHCLATDCPMIKLVADVWYKPQIGTAVFVTVEVVSVIKARLCTVHFSRLGIIKAIIADNVT